MSKNASIPVTPAASTTSVTPTGPALASTDTTLLPDDPTVLKQMIAELLRELRRERPDREVVQQRLDALLRRLYGPRPTPDNPQQPSLFPPARK
jgi:transposase